MTDDQNTGWTGGKRTFGDFAPGLVHYTGWPNGMAAMSVLKNIIDNEEN